METDRSYEEVMAAWGVSTDGRDEIAWVWDEVVAARRERDAALARAAVLVQAVSEAHGIPWESPVDVAIHVGNAVANAKADLAVVTRERDAALGRATSLADDDETATLVFRAGIEKLARIAAALGLTGAGSCVEERMIAAAKALMQERDAARAALRSDERQLCDDLILARRERDAAHAANAGLEARVVRAEQQVAAVAEERDAALARVAELEALDWRAAMAAAGAVRDERGDSWWLDGFGETIWYAAGKWHVDPTGRSPDYLLGFDTEEQAARAWLAAKGRTSALETLMQERDAALARADVAAALARADRRRVNDAIVDLIEADGSDTEQAAEDRRTIELVCAVLGVGDAG